MEGLDEYCVLKTGQILGEMRCLIASTGHCLLNVVNTPIQLYHVNRDGFAYALSQFKYLLPKIIFSRIINSNTMTSFNPIHQ